MSDFQDAVQKAIFDALTAAGIASGRVYDNPPAGATMPYVSFGSADEVEDDADCVDAVIVTQQVDVWSTALDGFREAKQIAAAVRRALHRQDIPMAGARLVEMTVRSIRTFRDPDGITSHAVVEVQALVEAA